MLTNFDFSAVSILTASLAPAAATPLVKFNAPFKLSVLPELLSECFGSILKVPNTGRTKRTTVNSSPASLLVDKLLVSTSVSTPLPLNGTLSWELPLLDLDSLSGMLTVRSNKREDLSILSMALESLLFVGI